MVEHIHWCPATTKCKLILKSAALLASWARHMPRLLLTASHSPAAIHLLYISLTLIVDAHFSIGASYVARFYLFLEYCIVLWFLPAFLLKAGCLWFIMRPLSFSLETLSSRDHFSLYRCALTLISVLIGATLTHMILSLLTTHIGIISDYS